ncbi:MAG: ABC-2 family transporter protein [Patescibacteria group bacterium]
MYWIVAIRQNPDIGKSLSTSFMVTYYLTIVTVTALIVSHMKDHIARIDIQQGELSQYLLRPYSYYFHNFLFEELPYRVIQGSYGLGVIAVIAIFFPALLHYEFSFASIIATLLSMVLGFLVCFNIEMILGLIALWFYDLRLFHSAYEVLFILLGGMNMPIFIFPQTLYYVALMTPFPAVMYIPTMIISGKIPAIESVPWLLYQLVWLIVTYAFYRLVWYFGIRRFTAAGI